MPINFWEVRKGVLVKFKNYLICILLAASQPAVAADDKRVQSPLLEITAFKNRAQSSTLVPELTDAETNQILSHMKSARLTHQNKRDTFLDRLCWLNQTDEDSLNTLENKIRLAKELLKLKPSKVIYGNYNDERCLLICYLNLAQRLLYLRDLEHFTKTMDVISIELKTKEWEYVSTGKDSLKARYYYLKFVGELLKGGRPPVAVTNRVPNLRIFPANNCFEYSQLLDIEMLQLADKKLAAATRARMDAARAKSPFMNFRAIVETSLTPEECLDCASLLRDCGQLADSKRYVEYAIKSSSDANFKKSAEKFLRFGLPTVQVTPKTEKAFRAALYAMNDRDWDRATQLLLRCTSECPQFDIAFAKLSEVALHKYDMTGAEKFARKSIEVNPSSEAGWRALEKAVKCGKTDQKLEEVIVLSHQKFQTPGLRHYRKVSLKGY